MTVFKINNKDLKLMNDMNQICKYLMNDYMITKNFRISSKTENFKPSLGLHYAELPSDYFETSEFFKNNIINDIQFSSTEIFSTFKNVKKKEIDHIKLDENGLCIVDKNDKTFHIGDLCLDDGDDTKIIDTLLDTNHVYTLNEFEIERLIKNNIFVIRYDMFKARTTKELLPNLKKTDLVEVYFTERSDGVLSLLFKIIKEETKIITYHIYSAINF